MIGPLPPPYGGVANFIENIAKQEVLKNIKIQIHRVGKRENDISLFRHFFTEISDLLNFVIKDKSNNVDIVHIHTSSYWSFYRTCIYFFVIKYLSNDYLQNGKIWIHIHGGKFDNFYENSSLIFKKLIRYILSNCEIIVTSPRWIPIFRNIILYDKRIFVVYNGFDNTFKLRPIIEVRNDIGLHTDKKILLNIGSLEEHKGHKYLIDSMEIIKEKRKDVLLYIIGEGSMEKELKKYIRDKGLDTDIFLLGRKPFVEVVDFINACDIVVLPSLFEGNPTVMFEALGYGKPFIGTNVGGIPDIIFSEDYGMLIDPSNTSDLTEKILKAIDKEWNYDKIRDYSNRFTWKNISRSLLDIYLCEK